eukprot:14217362-Alexandrium_andersonii.AAC.1
MSSPVGACGFLGRLPPTTQVGVVQGSSLLASTRGRVLDCRIMDERNTACCSRCVFPGGSA